MKTRLIYLSLFLFLLNKDLAFGQGTVLKKGAEQNYKGYVTSVATIQEDPTGFMKSFEVGIQWTTYFSEPVENYSFKWEANDHFKVNIEGKPVSISKYQLSKYPELLKEMESVTPAHLDVVLYGQASGGSVNVKLGHSPAESQLYEQNGGSVKKSGQSYRVYNLLATFVYKVRDANFLFARSGKRAAGSIVGGSPDWNNFIQWRGKNTYLGGGSSAIGSDVLNYSPEEYKKLSPEKKEQANQRFKNIYKAVNELKIKADIINLSWGSQLESIARRYLQKEKEDKKEKDKKADKEDDFWKGEKDTETAKNTKSGNDDFWNGGNETKTTSNKKVNDTDFWSGKNEKRDADKQSQNAFRIVNEYSQYNRSNEGKYSWVEDADGNIIIPKGKYHISSFKDGLAEIEILIRTDYYDFVPNRKVQLFERCFMDENGNKLPPKKHRLSYERYYNPFTLYSSDMTRAEIDESKRRNKAKDKNAWQQLKSIYSSQGFDL